MTARIRAGLSRVKVKEMFCPIIIDDDPDSAYGVTARELPGCFSGGETTNGALDNAVDAIECHVEGLPVNDEAIPRPRSVESHSNHTDFAGSTRDVVTVDVRKLL